MSTIKTDSKMEKLKFELVNGYGVLVDEKAKIEQGKTFLTKEKIPHTNYGYNYGDVVIAFAEPELGLDVPVFEWRDFEIDLLIDKELIKIGVLISRVRHPIYGEERDIAKSVYKSNPARYTEEDVFKIVNEYLKWLSENRMSQRTGKEVIHEILKSLQKYPQYVVMEEGEKIIGYTEDGLDYVIGYKPKLFTNSQGKQQGIVKELIWKNL